MSLEPYREPALGNAVADDEERFVRAEAARDIPQGDVVLWAGLPKRGLVLRASDAMTIPFSIVWGGFAIVWEVGVLSSGAPWFFALWGIPFVTIGLYLMVGRFFHDAWARNRTLYVVTNRRVIIVEAFLSRTMRTVMLANLPAVHFNEHRDGRGTITLGERTKRRNGPRTFELVGILRSRDVLAAIHKAHDDLQRLPEAPQPVSNA